MKKILNIIIILFLLFSCEEPRIEYLEIVPSGDTTLSYEGGKITVSVTAFEKPTATADHTWARTAVTEFADDTYKVTVTARQNIWENERAAVITVSAGALSDSFIVTQMAAPAGEDDEDDQEKEDQNDNGDGKDEDDENQGNDPPAKTYSLEMIGNQDIIIEEGVREARLQFETDIPLDSLSLSLEAEWMKASLSEGVISLSLDANDFLEDRTSAVKLEALVKDVRALEWNVLQNPEIVTPEGMVLFEDITFKKAVVRDYDTDSDRQISVAEAESIERLDVSGLGIRSLKGVEPMRNLQFLDIRDNLMADKDTSKVHIVDLSDPHPFLIDVFCDDYSAIDFTGCPAVVWTQSKRYPAILSEKTTIYLNQYIVSNNKYNDKYNRIKKPTRGNDISRKEEKIYLKKHTKGPGIPISFTIYNLIDVDIESGLDERIGQIFLDNLFLIEPIKSFEEYYDVVYVISEHIYRHPDDWPEDCDKSYDSEWWNDVTIELRNNGISLNPDIRSHTKEISIRDIIHNSIYAINHETVGHNIGRLGDEYIEHNTAAPSSKTARYFTNVIYDIENIPWYWQFLMEHTDYMDKVGLYEGALYKTGAWRSSYAASLMTNGEEMNALCRFVWLAHFLYDSDLYLEILPEFTRNQHKIWLDYEKSFEIESNRQALMDYFLEYDKRNL